MRLLPRLLHRFMRLPVRGRTRLPLALSRRFRSLQVVPVEIHGCPPIFVDLRDASSHDLFRLSPHAVPPWELMEQRIFRRLLRPGDVVVDVGANRGLHTVMFAAAVGSEGRVLAVEPNPSLAALLRHTIAGIPHAALLPAILGDASRPAELLIPENHEMASLADWTRDGAQVTVTCTMERLDDVIARGTIPSPDLLKVDVEGAELLVFRGARCTLDRVDAPIVVFESNAFAAPLLSGSITAAARFLSQLERPRFSFFLAAGSILARHHPEQVVHGNIVAVPEQRFDRWPRLACAGFVDLLDPALAEYSEEGQRCE